MKVEENLKRLNKIQSALNYWHDRLSKEYGEDHILNIALYGSQNYLLDTPNSDVDVKAIYVPSLKEAVINSKRISLELHNEENEHCELKDIREMCKMYVKQNINFLETLFTDYRWDNPHYSIISQEFKNYSDILVKHNIDYGIKSTCGQALHTIRFIIQERNNKKLAKVIHLYLYLNKWLSKKYTYKECIEVSDQEKFFHYNAKELLLKLKTDNFFIDDIDIIIFLQTYFSDTLNNQFFNKELIKTSKRHNNLINGLNSIAYEAIYRYCKYE